MSGYVLSPASELTSLRSYRPSLSVAIALLLCVISGPPALAQDYGWEIECAYGPKYFDKMTDRSLQLDALGRPHIAYGGDHLYYSRWDGAQWLHETVDDTPGVGEWATLALDASGFPRICYNDTRVQAIKYAYRDASGWQIEIVEDPELTPSNGIAFALSCEEVPHLTYITTRGVLRYARKDDASWHFETVDEGLTHPKPSLAVDDSGRVYIGYIWGRWLRYARRSDDGWHIQDIDYNSRRPSVSVGDDGGIHISYCHLEVFTSLWTAELRYAHVGPEGVSIEIVDTTDAVGEYSSIALDDESGIHIAYNDFTRGDLKYAQRLSSGWVTGWVDAEGETGACPSISLDDVGGVHFTCLREWPTRDLRYCYVDEDGWRRDTVCNGGGFDGSVSIALDQQSRVHMSWADGNWPWRTLAHAQRDETGWRTEMVSTGDYRPALTSIATNYSGTLHIGYVAHPASGGALIGHVSKDENEWTTETIALEACDWVQRFELVCGPGGQPHACYGLYFSPEEGVFGEVKYARHDSSGWHVSSVARYDAFTPSFAVDDSGFAHVVYVGNWDGMQYGYLDSTGWSFEQLDGGRCPSIALDQTNNPYITYTGGTSLKCCWKNGADWTYEIVGDITGQYYATAPVEVDTQGRIHIAYRGPDGGLRYAVRTQSGWEIQVVDTGYYLAEYLSLALGQDGSVHIGYSDGINRDVKYARCRALVSGTGDLVSPRYPVLRIKGPCPTAGMTQFTLFLSEPGSVNVSVVDIMGRRIQRLASMPQAQGEHHFAWNGADDHGQEVPSGTYIVLAEAGGQRVSKRIVMIR